METHQLHSPHWTWVTAPERIGNRHGGDCMHRWSLKTCVGVQPLSERGFETASPIMARPLAMTLGV